jgi:hypothetical protein
MRVLLTVFCLAVLAAACAPTVGDACTTNANCGSGLFCDLSTKGGYCTSSPCRDGECPEEATCVDFGAESSFCMRRCDDGQGCRDGLECRSDLGEIAFCGVAP